MTDESLILDLQRIAVDLEYDHESPDPIGILIDALREARPEASHSQLLTAMRRAITELELRVTAVNGWDLNYDIEDPRWRWLELMKEHIFLLGEAQINV
jgi:hypothetical protein